ncbi:MAG: hypothetical protein Fur0018_23060 [Anaerolineales bacterium]
MFAKKKTPPFVLQVLTMDYLIEGTAEGASRLTIPSAPDYSFSPLRLTDVQIQAARPDVNPPQTCAEFMVLGHNVVAFIPHIALGQLDDYNFMKIPQTSIQGTFYFGPYVMRGKLMVKTRGHFAGWEQIPMLDLRIPGTPWGEIHAPFALVNCRWLHGYACQQAAKEQR